MDIDGDAAPYARVVHAYPAVLAFLNRHGPEAVAVLDDLVAHAGFDDGQLVVAASVRQVADRLAFTSKDTVNRRLRQLLAAGVITRLADHGATRFAVPVYVLHLDATGICRGTVPSPLGLNADPPIDTMALTSLSQLPTDECTDVRGTPGATR